MSLARQFVLLVFLMNCSPVFASLFNNELRGEAGYSSIDNTYRLQQNNKDTVVIPFEYKQSALYHSFTLEVIDSVINILLKNKAVTLSIEGYAHVNEGSDSICYYLSLNRALFIRDYVLGRGVDSSRIISITGFGRSKPTYRKINTQGVEYNCRAEIGLNYPVVAKKAEIQDKDGDGIADNTDKCPDEFGDIAHDGCPNKDAVIVPFENQQSFLHAMTYRVLDSVIAILSENPTLTISIEGHAYKNEGIKALCDRLANDRADIVKNYLLSRRIDISRIDSVKGFGNSRPINAGNNPQEELRNARAEIILSHH